MDDSGIDIGATGIAHSDTIGAWGRNEQLLVL